MQLGLFVIAALALWYAASLLREIAPVGQRQIPPGEPPQASSPR